MLQIADLSFTIEVRYVDDYFITRAASPVQHIKAMCVTNDNNYFIEAMEETMDPFIRYNFTINFTYGIVIDICALCSLHASFSLAESHVIPAALLEQRLKLSPLISGKKTIRVNMSLSNVTNELRKRGDLDITFIPFKDGWVIECVQLTIPKECGDFWMSRWHAFRNQIRK